MCFSGGTARKKPAENDVFILCGLPYSLFPVLLLTAPYCGVLSAVSTAAILSSWSRSHSGEAPFVFVLTLKKRALPGALTQTDSDLTADPCGSQIMHFHASMKRMSSHSCNRNSSIDHHRQKLRISSPPAFSCLNPPILSDNYLRYFPYRLIALFLFTFRQFSILLL